MDAENEKKWRRPDGKRGEGVDGVLPRSHNLLIEAHHCNLQVLVLYYFNSTDTFIDISCVTHVAYFINSEDRRPPPPVGII
jgi:hypothetical protein